MEPALSADPVAVAPVDVAAPEVVALIDALTTELAGAGYTDDETFGYSIEQLAASGVHLVGARVGGRLVGVGGVELAASGGVGELKRFYVDPHHRGQGVADAVLDALVDHARSRGADRLRLETGDDQHAAIAFYRRRGFVHIPRFGPYVHSERSVCMQRDLDVDPVTPERLRA